MPSSFSQWLTTSRHRPWAQVLNTNSPCCLRGAVNNTRRDMIRNDKIGKMAGITQVHHYILQQRIRQFGRLIMARMNPNQLAHKAVNSMTLGYKAWERPRKTWFGDVKERLKTYHISPTKPFRLATDRQFDLSTTSTLVTVDGHSKVCSAFEQVFYLDTWRVVNGCILL